MNNKNYEFFLLKQENLRLKEENSKLRKEVKNPKSLLDSAFGIMFSAFLADITFNFLFFFNELLGEKVEIEASGLHLCYTTQYPSTLWIEFSIMLASIPCLGLMLYLIWRKKK
jgi:hypothetical protein